MTKDQWVSTALGAVAMTALLAGWIVSLAASDTDWSVVAAVSFYVLAGGAAVTDVLYRFRSHRDAKRR
ncbi:fatty-acid desaturase [Curtobacterium flaccumfaciens]|uniref:Fatty-acid desaturase n=1 Tax=Curtobacterium salicis TaxID=1779862 RepID=A0ABX0TFN4_9MICO|nr:fatty-acid desaturase [Curtobacterium sp. WW7]